MAGQTGHHLVLARLGEATGKKHTKGIFIMAVIVLPFCLSHEQRQPVFTIVMMGAIPGTLQ